MIHYVQFLTVWACVLAAYAAKNCPNRCACQSGSSGTVVICHGLDFTRIPDGLPADTREMLFKGHQIDTLHADHVPRLENLTTLMLKSCGIRTIETGAFSRLRNLVNLDLSSNIIQHLQPGMFLGLTSLRNLRLDYNPFTTLADDSFSGLTLTQLAMENNPELVEMSSAAFRDCRVSQLSLYNCSLNRHSSIALRTLSDSLRELSWENNRLPLSIDSDLFAGFTFSHLNLNQNGIYNVSFLQHVKADDLSLDGNPIGTVDFSGYSGLQRTRRLSLANTSMFYINGSSFDGMEQLDSLYLNDNHIRTFTDELLDVFDRLTSLSLYGNPLHCNCQVKWLKEWIQHTPNFMGNVLCSTPMQQPLKNVQSESLLCEKPSELRLGIMTHSWTEDAVLRCKAVADPAPEIVLSDPNGNEIWRTPPNRTNFTTRSEFHVSAKKAAPGGTYTCVGFNLAGNLSAHTYMKPYVGPTAGAESGTESMKCATVFITACAALTNLIVSLVRL